MDLELYKALRDYKQKKEPIKAPIKIDKESAQKSIINFHQSLKKMQSHL